MPGAGRAFGDAVDRGCGPGLHDASAGAEPDLVMDEVRVGVSLRPKGPGITNFLENDGTLEVAQRIARSRRQPDHETL